MPPELPIYIIDDEPEMCRSLALLLAAEGLDAQCFDSADIFLKRQELLPVGIIVCDVVMPGTSGVELIRNMESLARVDPVIVIAGHADVALAVETMKAGALDFVEKPFDAATILAAIAAAREVLKSRNLPTPNGVHLSHRERQVLDLVVAGLTSKEAARELGISPRTVETYRVNLLKKAGSACTAELIRFGLTTSEFADLPT